MVLYFENLSIINFFHKNHRRLLYNNYLKIVKIIYYVDITVGGKLIKYILSNIFNVELTELNFTLLQICSKEGELVRSRLHRKDLFELQERIIQSKEFISFSNPKWNKTRLSNYIKKGLFDGSLSRSGNSYSRTLFLINVIEWHSRCTGVKKPSFFLNKRPWQSILAQYANDKSIKLIFLGRKNRIFKNEDIIDQLRKTPRLFTFLKNLKSITTITAKSFSYPNKVYIVSRGGLYFSHRGYPTDFFWVINSNFNSKKVVYKYKNYREKNILEKNYISATNGFTKYYAKKYDKKIYKVSSNEFPLHHIEREQINNLLSRFISDKNYWYSFFKSHNIKVFLTWYDNNADHMAIADALNETGGIAAYWQTSFYGFKNIECKTNLDVGFYYSKWSSELSQATGSLNKHYVITGFLNDYASFFLKDQALQIRNRLKLAGAKKIINVMDENSAEDDRWHTGLELQRENYSHILEKVLDNPWLGVVFKPKAPKTLRYRLGQVNDLLKTAEGTGRCLVLDNPINQNIKPPPLLAGLAADVSIHGHLSAGTAALECALQGLPTLLIDREGTPHSMLNVLPRDLVVFKTWPETIDALLEHFKAPNGIPGFGDWSQHIEVFDPFRDGKAAYRMGTYMQWLIEGFDKGFDRDKVMIDAAEKYTHLWGSDKVYISN